MHSLLSPLRLRLGMNSDQQVSKGNDKSAQQEYHEYGFQCGQHGASLPAPALSRSLGLLAIQRAGFLVLVCHHATPTPTWAHATDQSTYILKPAALTFLHSCRSSPPVFMSYGSCPTASATLRCMSQHPAPAAPTSSTSVPISLSWYPCTWMMPSSVTSPVSWYTAGG